MKRFSCISFISISLWHVFSPKRREKNGFTLIELVVVMAIIGVLTTIAGGSFILSQQRARDARRKSDLVNVGKSLEMFYNDHGTYPADSSGRISGCGEDSIGVCAWGSAFIDEYGTVYMEALPSETNASREYVYITDDTQTKYQLFVRLENLNDKTLDRDGDGEADEYSVSCGNDNCNFAVTSPNATATETL